MTRCAMTIPGAIAIAVAMIAVSAGAGVAIAQSADSASGHGSLPRTPWGDPDLQGTWTTDDTIGVPSSGRPRSATSCSSPMKISRSESSNRSKHAAQPQPPVPLAPVRHLSRHQTIGVRAHHNRSVRPRSSSTRQTAGFHRSRPRHRSAPPGGTAAASVPVRSTVLRTSPTSTAASHVAWWAPCSRDRTATDSTSSRARAFVAISYEMIHEPRIIPIGSAAARW